MGKTTLVANLGSLWAKEGKKTLLIDGDWTLGKLSIAIGVRPKWTVEQVISGEIPLHMAVQKVNDNLFLLASPSGVIGLEQLDGTQRNQLYFDIESLGSEYDLVVFDHASGVDWDVLQFAAAAHQHVIVTTTEPTSYMDAYAIMKILSKRFGIRDFALVVTMSARGSETDQVLGRFTDFVREQLLIRLDLLDVFPWEPALAEAIRRQRPYVGLFPDSNLTSRFGRLCQKIEGAAVHPSGGLRFFHHQNFGYHSSR